MRTPQLHLDTGSLDHWITGSHTQSPSEPVCCCCLPRSILLMFSLHHVAKASISQSLSEVSVRGHEAVVVEAWPQAGRAQTKGFALRTAGPTQNTLILGGQIGTKQGLQQLRNTYT